MEKIDLPTHNIFVKKVLGAVAITAILAGCATRHVGNAPGPETGQNKDQTLPTETLTPGVASALFPNPESR